MRDAFDDLERDLRAAVRARRRRRLPSAPVFAVIGALVLGGGGAVAATQIARDPDVERVAAKLADRAASELARVPACRPVRSRPVPSGAVLPSIARALPALRGSVRAAGRTLSFADGVRVRVRVVNGPDLLARADPGACLAARRARVRELSARRPVEVRSAAEREIVRMRDTAPGLQTLWVNVLRRRGQGGFGVGTRLRPGEALPTGVLAGDGRLSVGIADPRAVRVRSGSRSARVVDGFYVIAARGQVTELAADGSVIRRTPASGRRTSGP